MRKAVGRGGTSGRRVARPRGGFTAEELIVVLGIIVLLVIGFFWVTRNVSGMARMTSCASNLKQLHHASRMYMADYSGLMPPEERLPGALHAHTNNQQLFRCPAVHTGRRRGYSDGDELHFPSDYEFAVWVRDDDPAQVLLVRDDEPDRHVSRTWLSVRLDGAAVRFDEDDWNFYWNDPVPWMEEGMTPCCGWD